MKPCQLSIGDWILFTDPDDGVTEAVQLEQEDFTGGCKFFDQIGRLPFDYDFLRKNDFMESRTEQGPVFTRCDDGYEVSLWMENCNWYSWRIRVKLGPETLLNTRIMAVSQLQQALRLFELYDFANNLKY